jgi:hypothetical protein
MWQENVEIIKASFEAWNTGELTSENAAARAAFAGMGLGR